MYVKVTTEVTITLTLTQAQHLEWLTSKVDELIIDEGFASERMLEGGGGLKDLPDEICETLCKLRNKLDTVKVL